MNIQEYISSGIIESYVLGLASAEERNEFEKICAQYPEVLQARIGFELALEKQAMENAITPPPELKERILAGIKVSHNTGEAPVIKMNWWKYAAAACIFLLAGSVYWNLSLRRTNKELRTNYDNSMAKLNDLQNDINVLQQNPHVKMASMKGQEISPASFATVYWDTASQDVYLMVNNMPAPPSGKQYQLWAFLDGKPIDMGLVEITEKPLQLYRLKKAQAAQAFAITLETRDRPDVSKPGGAVYVMGPL